MSIISLILIGILFLVIASLIALVYAVASSEEGYEDSTGFHRKEQSVPATTTTSTTVDTGNPWDQIEGASCPLNLGQPFRPLGPGDFSVHQP